MTPRELARIAYKEYGQVTDFKNFRGEPMPEFAALPDKIKEAWEQASQKAHAIGYYEAMKLASEYFNDAKKNIDDAKKQIKEIKDIFDREMKINGF